MPWTAGVVACWMLVGCLGNQAGNVSEPDTQDVAPGETATPAACEPGGEWFVSWTTAPSQQLSGVAFTPDGGLLAVGARRDEDEPSRSWIVRTDADGATVSQEQRLKTHTKARPRLVAVDEGYVVFGHGPREEEIGLVALDATGTLRWELVVATPEYTVKPVDLLAADDGLWLVGTTASYIGDEAEVFVARIDAAGELEWTETYGRPQERDVAVGAVVDGDGVVVAAARQVAGGASEIWVFQLGGWEHTLTGFEQAGPKHIVGAAGGGTLIIGTADDPGGTSGHELRAAALTRDGELRWQKSYGDGSAQQVTYAVASLGAAGYAAAGWDGSQLHDVVWRFGPDGEALSVAVVTVSADHLIALADGGLLLAGTEPIGPEPGLWLARLDARDELRWEVLDHSERYTQVGALTVGPDGAIAVAGAFWDKQWSHEAWLLRLDDDCRAAGGGLEVTGWASGL